MKGLLLTYPIVLLGGIISLRQPVIGLFIYVGLSVLRPDALWGWAGGLQNMSRISGIPLLIGWAFQSFGSWRFGQARAIVILLMLYAAWLPLSASQAIEPVTAWATVLEFSKTLLPFLVGMTLIKSEKQARQMLWVIVLCQTYVCLDMNRTYLGGYNRAHAEGFGGMDNNSFGISLLTTLGGGLGLLLSSKSWISKAAAGVATLLMLHTVLLTFSRGAFVGLLAVGIGALVILPKKPKYLATIALAVLIAIRLTGPELSARLGSTFAPREDRDGSSQSRLDLWKDCFTLIAREPLFGVGPTGWGTAAQEFGWPKGKEAHSTWIETAAELGVPGAAFLILFYALTVKRLWPIARGKAPGVDRTTAPFATGIILCIVGYALSAQFVSLMGIEAPFWVTMVGAVLLKIRSVPEVVPAQAPVASWKVSARPGTPSLPTRRPLVRPS
jgi:O-antigen ligase